MKNLIPPPAPIRFGRVVLKALTVPALLFGAAAAFSLAFRQIHLLGMPLWEHVKTTFLIFLFFAVVMFLAHQVKMDNSAGTIDQGNAPSFPERALTYIVALLIITAILVFMTWAVVHHPHIVTPSVD